MISTDYVQRLSDSHRDLYKRYVRKHSFTRTGKKMVTCAVECWNGFEIVGVAGCADVSKFDYGIGCEFALKDALEQLQPMVVFHVAQTSMESNEKKSSSYDTNTKNESARPAGVVFVNGEHPQKVYTVDEFGIRIKKC